MIKFSTLHKRWMKDPRYRREYEALEEEFALMAEVAQARARSGLSQAELARRMNTTQSTIAQLESGRALPSTRTLARFAKGHRPPAEDQLRAGAEEGQEVTRMAKAISGDRS
jgi:transcriptional regulator with XRE-family HTH domain